MNKEFNWSACLSDKGPDNIGYNTAYDKYLLDKRYDIQSVLEIGCTHRSNGLWLDYFPNAKIVGADIRSYNYRIDDRFEYVKFNQSNKKDHYDLLEKYKSFDIIIDDGPHSSPEQLISMQLLLPYVKSGGGYIIEDLSVSDKTDTTMDRYLRYKRDSEITVSELCTEWSIGTYKKYTYINGNDFSNMNLEIYFERGTVELDWLNSHKVKSQIIFIKKL